MFRALCALLLLAGSAQGAIINGDFEDGLNGWTVESESPPHGTASVDPLNGSDALVLTITDDTQQAVIEVSQEFTLLQTMWLSADFTAELTGNEVNTFGYGISVFDEDFNVYTLYDTQATGEVSLPWTTGWLKLSPGNYKVFIRASEAGGDPAPFGFFAVDNVTLSVPEPATFLLAGFLPLAFALKRLQQRK